MISIPHYKPGLFFGGAYRVNRPNFWSLFDLLFKGFIFGLGVDDWDLS